MVKKILTLCVLAGGLITNAVASYAGGDNLNRYPSEKTIKKVEKQLFYNRAIETYLWSMPAMSVYGWRRATHEFTGSDKDAILIFNKFAWPQHLGLTVNNSSIYVVGAISLKNKPYVLKAPKDVLGFIDDLWQRPISDVGLLDKGNSENLPYLILPPGYSANIPSGYKVVKSKTNNLFIALRGLVREGDINTAVQVVSATKLYPLTEGPEKSLKFYKVGLKPLSTLVPRGSQYFIELFNLLNGEPVEERDIFFYGMMRTLGYTHGRKFRPSKKIQALLEKGASNGETTVRVLAFGKQHKKMMAYPDRQWQKAFPMNGQQRTATHGQLDERARYTYYAISYVDGMDGSLSRPAGSAYEFTIKDSKGQALDGAHSYKLELPKDIPARLFWSLAIYDVNTRSQIAANDGIPVLSSRNKLDYNGDGSVTLYLGPVKKPGFNNNWIKTKPNEDFLALMRFYLPTRKYYNGTWKTNDIKRLD